ncbi:hypothetical protein ACFX2I_041857 [Malus domestica]
MVRLEFRSVVHKFPLLTLRPHTSADSVIGHLSAEDASTGNLSAVDLNSFRFSTLDSQFPLFFSEQLFAHPNQTASI